MDDFGSIWTFQENVEDLKQKLNYVTYELELTRKQTSEEIMKNNDDIRKLLMLLQSTSKERDEAKAELVKLQELLFYNNNNNKIINIDQQSIPKSPFSPDSPLMSNFPGRANSGVTESNSFSQPMTQSHVSSPVVDSSPETNNICYNSNSSNTDNKSCDGVTLIMEKLAKGRVRPKQGEFLQAVIEAGPLLQTLMVAGSLPRWRNPPGRMTSQIPPLQIKGNSNGNNDNSNGSKRVVKGFDYSGLYGEIDGGFNPSSVLDFGGRMLASSVSFDCSTPKRQRIL